MIKSPITQQAKKALVGLVSMLVFALTAHAQNDSTVTNDLERTFMPELQMGYVAHGTEQLSGGLMTQTSIEYRDISNFVLRINYDVFNSSLNLTYPVDENVSYTGKTSFSEVIGGIGYRQPLKKHNITSYIQSGVRFYGYPVFNVDSNEVNIDFDRRYIGVMRYSIGYEYRIIPKLFLTVEFLAGHVLKSKDYWADNRWSYGVTLGLSAPLL